MAKWTKKDIAELCQTLSTFWLVNRPLRDSLSETLNAADKVRQVLNTHRTKIVIDGLLDFRSLCEKREERDQGAADHFKAHPEVYGSSTPEMISRFEKLAENSRKDIRKIEKLIERINAEGLPLEVMTFDPVAKLTRTVL